MSELFEKCRKSVLQTLSANEVAEIGKMFFFSLAAELLLPEETLEELGYDVEKAKEPKPLTGVAVDLVSVEISDEEKTSGKLFPSTVKNLVERLEVHGMAVIQNLFDRERCKRVAHEAHRKILDPVRLLHMLEAKV